MTNPTPQTDALEQSLTTWTIVELDRAMAHARKLEQERDSYREQNINLREQLVQEEGKHTELQRQLDSYREKAEIARLEEYIEKTEHYREEAESLKRESYTLHSLRLAEQTLKNLDYCKLTETERQLFHALVELLNAVKDIQGDSIPTNSK